MGVCVCITYYPQVPHVLMLKSKATLITSPPWKMHTSLLSSSLNRGVLLNGFLLEKKNATGEAHFLFMNYTITTGGPSQKERMSGIYNAEQNREKERKSPEEMSLWICLFFPQRLLCLFFCPAVWPKPSSFFVLPLWILSLCALSLVIPQLGIPI